MLTQEEIDDWYFDTPITRPINPAKEPVDCANRKELSEVPPRDCEIDEIIYRNRTKYYRPL